MMDIKTKKGTLAFPVGKDSVSILRLLKHHAPFLELVGKSSDGRSFLVFLGEMDFDRPDTIPSSPNYERSQLAALGKVNKA